MKMRSFFLVPMGLMMLTTACAHQHHGHGHGHGHHGQRHYPVQPMPVQQIQYEEEHLRVSGRGAVVPDVTQTQAQQKLMAMRASRMDAYRNLAERLYGIELEGSTTVRQMAARHDTVRSFINRHVAGARVVETVLMDDNIYQTTLELTVGRRFYSCVTYPSTCSTVHVPAPTPVRAPVPVSPVCEQAPCQPVSVPRTAPRNCGSTPCERQPVYTRYPERAPRQGSCPTTDCVHAPYETYR
ncbi:hypothetical protein SAMN05421721_12330 [Ectothiorhodospira mobilis]|uniref:Lipoprotein LPP20-like domain-containing protein n=1 Tax=Ectothiorhodospira mobilis TaxID=195064 RepID=A0A1I4SWQ4_ECTMO|nr:LPP20 family lipoprotein [Ectothiorhodospira mobilis]SFM68835.1 hypothetical protein SAMN05421721_12330 [Ectothiorhodospira mobilis]